MRKAPVFFSLMLIGAPFAFPAQANGQCEALTEAASIGDRDRTASLIASGVSVNCSYTGSYVEKDSGKTVTYISTPLNDVAWGGSHESVRLLLSHGANVNLKDGKGRTPLYYADDFLLYLDFMGGTDKDWDDAEEVYRLLKEAGGVSE